MKKLSILSVFICLFILISAMNVSAAKRKRVKEIKVDSIVRVLAPVLPLLKERRIESEIIKNVRKGQEYPLKRTGENYIEVYLDSTKTESGWLELGLEKPKIVVLAEGDKSYILKQVIFFLIFVLLIGAIIAIVSFVNKKSQAKKLKEL